MFSLSPRFVVRNSFLAIITIFLFGIYISINTSNIEDLNSELIINPCPPEEPIIIDWREQLLLQSKNYAAHGHQNTSRKFIIIGISTLYRKENYLRTTLESFINESTPEERRKAVIVIFLADTNPTAKKIQLHKIHTTFQPFLDSGFIQVIESNSSIYPTLNTSLRNINNESSKRIKWRAKQVVDFAFLISYATSLSAEYYLVMEDDIITVPKYITAIKEFIRSKQAQPWVTLRFSLFVGIGLLFKTEDLPKLVDFLIMFHTDLPVDMLLRKFSTLLIAEGENIRRIPSLFQHIGIKSTLERKYQIKTDKTFTLAQRKFRNSNPPADVFTTMKVLQEFYPQYAYKETPGFFWGVVQNPGDTYDIVFPSPIPVSRIVVLTGISTTARRKITNGTVLTGSLELGERVRKILPNGCAFCESYARAVDFKKGEIDINIKKDNAYQCVRVKVNAKRGTHVVIKEIEIFS